MCTLYGGPVPTEVCDESPDSDRLLATGPLASPWHAAPPAGVPTAGPTPVRTLNGGRVQQALLRPAFASYTDVGATTLPLGSCDRPASTASLSIETMVKYTGSRYGSYTAIVGSTIDGQRAVRVSATIDIQRYSSELTALALQTDDRFIVFPQPGPILGGALFGLDRTV